MGPMRNGPTARNLGTARWGMVCGSGQVNGLAGLGIRSLGLAQALTTPGIFGESLPHRPGAKDPSLTLTSKRIA